MYTYIRKEDRGLLWAQKITGYLPKDDGAKLAFKDADIVVIPAGIPRMYAIIRELYKVVNSSIQASQE
jgi:malate/lactate dehydrogenase